MSIAYFLLIFSFARVEAYSNKLFTVPETYFYTEDPYDIIERDLHRFLYGPDTEVVVKDDVKPNSLKKLADTSNQKPISFQYVSGNAFRSELFKNKSGAHLVSSEFVHRGYSLLNITNDYMQTALNAFAIFLYGNKQDILRLPADYVLQSTRTISMMKIEQEKLSATWEIVKGDKRTEDISYETLEQYRPLFKYVKGHEMAKLNLKDERILRYIGTHPDLNRHQVGVVASRYTSLNRRWNESKYLNKMNNLLCGVPITFMRGVPSNSYLQLSHQVFYHIRACDRLQRRFYLAMMTKTMALGKSNSWNAQDVSRLGLLLAEVDDSQLTAINPEAMAGISPQFGRAAKSLSLSAAACRKELRSNKM